MFCAIWYHFVQFRKREKHPWRNVTFGGMLLLGTLKACNFTKSNTPPWVFFTFFKLYKMVPNRATHHIFGTLECLT